MPNLVEQLGHEYCDNFLRGVVFRHDSKLYLISRFTDEHIVAHRLQPDPLAQISEREVRLPLDTLPDWSALSYPRMGYRPLCDKAVAYLTKNNSVHRGLHGRDITATTSFIERCVLGGLGIRVERVFGELGKQLLTFDDRFMSFKDGFAAIQAGDIVSFCMSPDVAVKPIQNGYLGILYRERQIGTVKEDGTVQILHTPSTYMWERLNENH